MDGPVIAWLRRYWGHQKPQGVYAALQYFTEQTAEKHEDNLARVDSLQLFDRHALPRRPQGEK